MTLVSVDVYQTMRVATVHGQENHQITQAIDRDRLRSRLSYTTVKYVKSAVQVPRYDIF